MRPKIQKIKELKTMSDIDQNQSREKNICILMKIL